MQSFPLPIFPLDSSFLLLGPSTSTPSISLDASFKTFDGCLGRNPKKTGNSFKKASTARLNGKANRNFYPGTCRYFRHLRTSKPMSDVTNCLWSSLDSSTTVTVGQGSQPVSSYNGASDMVDSNLDFSGFDFTGIDVDELLNAINHPIHSDTQSQSETSVCPEDFDFTGIDFSGVSDASNHSSGGMEAQGSEFELSLFDFGGRVESQAPTSEDTWNTSAAQSPVGAVLSIGTGVSTVESSVKGLYYPGTNLFVPIDLDVFQNN